MGGGFSVRGAVVERVEERALLRVAGRAGGASISNHSLAFSSVNVSPPWQKALGPVKLITKIRIAFFMAYSFTRMPATRWLPLDEKNRLVVPLASTSQAFLFLDPLIKV